MAEVQPIELSGAVITFASLANYQLVKQKNINTGDIVEISRRGDVIPYIEKVVNKVSAKKPTIPSHCSSCHTLLKKEAKFLRCPNSLACPSQTLGSLRLFCKFLDIKGISDKTIQKLVKAKKVKLAGDFYKLKITDINQLAGLGDKSAQNIINQIQAKRHISLVQALTAATIPNFSKKRIQQAVNAGFNTPKKILNLTVTDLASLPGFQSTLSQKIIQGIDIKKPTITSILDQITLKTTRQSSQFKHLSFAITGTLSRPRKQITSDIESAGGQIVDAVTKNTSYLISNLNKSNSSKFKTAKKLSIPIISEKKLNHMLQ